MKAIGYVAIAVVLLFIFQILIFGKGKVVRDHFNTQIERIEARQTQNEKRFERLNKKIQIEHYLQDSLKLKKDSIDVIITRLKNEIPTDSVSIDSILRYLAKYREPKRE